MGDERSRIKSRFPAGCCQAIQGEPDPVIRDPASVGNVGSDLFASIPEPTCFFFLPVILSLLFFELEVQQPRPQTFMPWLCSCAGILILQSHKTGGRWVMRPLAESVLLTCWPPGPEDPEHVIRSSFSVDHDIHFLRPREEPPRSPPDVWILPWASVFRHPLHAVDTPLPLERL